MNYENLNSEFEINNKKEKRSKISLVLFLVIIIANIVIYPLSLTEDESSGMTWFFLVLLPSIPLYFVSFVFAIDSVKNYFDDKKKNLRITKVRKIFAFLNIIQLILMTIIFILIYKYMTI